MLLLTHAVPAKDAFNVTDAMPGVLKFTRAYWNVVPCAQITAFVAVHLYMVLAGGKVAAPKFWYIVPLQTDEGDNVEITGTNGSGLTVIVFAAISVPQLFVTVYLMIDVPAEIPVTTPPATTAAAVLLLHIPPVAISVNVIGVPIQIAPGPVIVPA